MVTGSRRLVTVLASVNRPPSATASQFFNRLVTLPTAARQLLYSHLIDALVAQGIWAKLDVLYVFAAADSATSLINLVSSSFPATQVIPGGAPTFTVDRGWTGATISTCIDSGYNPTTAAGHFVRDDAMVGGWSLTATEQNFNLFTMSDGTAQNRVLPASASHLATYNINDTTSSTVASTDASGFWLANRTGANSKELFKNGASVASAAVASTAPINKTVYFVPGPIQGSAGFIGSSLTAGQVASLYTALQTYLHSVGAV